MSLLRYLNTENGKQREPDLEESPGPSSSRRGAQKPVWYNRTLKGEFPYRGPALPLRDEEFESLTEVVCDAHVETFDTSDPEQRERLRKTLDDYANGWVRIIHADRRWVEGSRNSPPRMLVYMEWFEPYRELNETKARNMFGTGF